MEIKTTSKELKTGANYRVEYITSDGAKNSFGIDVVFAIPTHKKLIKFFNHEITSASIENIVSDKLDAIHRFQTRNTRMKDFDDLYRLAQSEVRPNAQILKQLQMQRNGEKRISKSVLSVQLQETWREYTSRRDYKAAKTLPKDISEVIDFINEYLDKL